MKIAERLAAPKGHWKLEIYDGDIQQLPARQLANGLIVPGGIVTKKLDQIEGDNLVTTVGKGLLLDRLFALGTPPTQVNSMGVGTVSTAAAAGDTQLNSGGGGSSFLQAFDSLPTRAGTVVTAISTFATGSANFSWAELAMFNGTTNGSSLMFNRIAPIGPFTKTAAVSIVVTVSLTQS